MAGALQGFTKTNNLAENTQDRTALNNLGTAPIADDISLFINNSQNVSTLTIFETEYDRISGLVTIVNNTQELSRFRSAVFTNGDPIRLNYINGTLIKDNIYIRSSDGETVFGFANNVELTDEYTFRPTGDFIVTRSDKVVLENLTYLGIENVTSSNSTGLSSGDGSVSDVYGILGGSYRNAFTEIYSYLDVAKYQAKKKFVSDQDVATDDKFEVEGIFTIRDPGNTIVEEGLNLNSPGLYITNPESPVGNIQKILAFSDAYNPWDQSTTGGINYLTTTSASVTAGDLILNNGFDITGIAPITESGTVSNTTFTHKVPFILNGVTYYLCLTNT
jgi:hypothetical protein